MYIKLRRDVFLSLYVNSTKLSFSLQVSTTKLSFSFSFTLINFLYSNGHPTSLALQLFGWPVTHTCCKIYSAMQINVVAKFTNKINQLVVFVKQNFLSIKYLAFRSIENVTPCCSFNLVFSLMWELSCLFSSHIPISSSLEDALKFVELHHAFLKHDWRAWRLKPLNNVSCEPLIFPRYEVAWMRCGIFIGSENPAVYGPLKDKK